MPSKPQTYRDRVARMHVLVVDAFYEFRQVLRGILLDDIGVAFVSDAKTGKQALAMMQENAFDLVIADTAMQPLGAVELTTMIREGSGGGDPRTPVIAVSGQPKLADILAARDAGVDEYLAKPLSAKILQLRIHSIIEHPRPFVCADDFVGPDRRRHHDGTFAGEDRRHDVADMAKREA